MKLTLAKVLVWESSIKKVVLYSTLCLLAATFANSLDPEQDRQNVGPDLDPSCLTP